MLSIIVAKAKNNVIGKDNKMIWHIPDDMKRFKKLTMNHTIIMGKNTFESLGRVLPKRFHVVLTRNKNYKINNKNVLVIKNISELKKYINDENENFVIGGASIYKQLINKCEKLYVTQIDKDFDGDTFFPEIDNKKFKIVEKNRGPKDDNNFEYYYVTYERINEK